MQHTDFSWRTGSDQLKIHGKVWQPLPGTPTHAVIALVHGMGEHSGRYRRLAEFFTARGIAVISYDQRGHGKSEGKQGHITHYNQLLDGIDELLEKTRLQFKNKPIFLYGHSMGGNLVLNYALKKPNTVKGIVVTGPWLRLAFDPPAIQVKLANLMRNLYPGFSQASGLKTENLSRDPEVVKAYTRDRLVHDRITASFFVNLYQAGLYALQHANELKVPALLMHGGSDKITSAQASEEFAKKASLVTQFHLWDGMYHEIHNEPEREVVLTKVFDWISAHLDQ
jgi:alpha-beta hydrolase superfamily lysophospholipase